ncbi:MAG: endonuclease [Candidatus Sedimenticola endophacoides]
MRLGDGTTLDGRVRDVAARAGVEYLHLEHHPGERGAPRTAPGPHRRDQTTVRPLLLLLCLLPLSACPEQERGQRFFTEYREVYPLFWGRLYAGGGETLYCARRFGPDKGRGINIEHVFPMAWMMNAEGCRSRRQCRERSPRFNRIEADMHNLYPARSDINEARASLAFGEIPGEQRRFGGCDFELGPRQRLVEPRPAVRGNIARAMFHMHETYGLTLFKRQGRLLQRWNRADPPDAEERRRNREIEAIQGTRNRFIDDHGAADRLTF